MVESGGLGTGAYIVDIDGKLWVWYAWTWFRVAARFDVPVIER